jgi:hypothetical protein
MSPWGKYSVYKDIARFEYGRLLWKNPFANHWPLAHRSNPGHPNHQRFLTSQTLIEKVLSSQASEEELDENFRK